MSAHDVASTLGRARLSFASVADIDEFVATLDKFERGELTPDQWRAFRLVRGTYGQRQAEDAQMLRVKIPQGVLTAEQLEIVDECARRTLDISMNGNALSNLERARLLHILLWCRDVAVTLRPERCAYALGSVRSSQ